MHYKLKEVGAMYNIDPRAVSAALMRAKLFKNGYRPMTLPKLLIVIAHFGKPPNMEVAKRLLPPTVYDDIYK